MPDSPSSLATPTPSSGVESPRAQLVLLRPAVGRWLLGLAGALLLAVIFAVLWMPRDLTLARLWLDCQGTLRGPWSCAADGRGPSRLQWLLAALSLAAVVALLVIGGRFQTRARDRRDRRDRNLVENEQTQCAYMLLLDQAPQAIAIIHPARLTARINSAMAALLHVEKNTALEPPWSWQQIVAKDDWAAWCDAERQARQSGQAQWLRVSVRLGPVDVLVVAQLTAFSPSSHGSLNAHLAVVLTPADTGAVSTGFYLRELLHLAELEKWQFGQALHDELGQRLSGMAFMTKALERKLTEARRPEADDAAWLTQLAKESITVSRGVARGLVPVCDADPTAFEAALADLCRSLGMSFDTQFSVEADPGFNPGGMAQANHLYHAAQELMTNAVVHGRARTVVVRLQVNDTAQRLIVHNDGCDPDPVAMRASRGMGLSGVRSRAAHLGGQFVLRTEPSGMGVVAILELPLPGTMALPTRKAESPS